MSLTCLGLRGATTVDTNTKEAVVEATEELLREMASANDLAEEHVAAIFFTTTKDVNAEFPAVRRPGQAGLERHRHAQRPRS